MSKAKTSRGELARVITEQLLAEPARRSQIMQSLAAYLVEHKLADKADMILNDIAHELFLQTGVLTAEVVSAKDLTDVTRQELIGLLKQETGARSVQLRESIDADLIGGLIARTPEAEFDVSVRASLRKLTAIA